MQAGTSYLEAILMFDALNAWRAAERAWEAADPAALDYRSSAIAVVTAWLRYQELAEHDQASFVMVADADHVYVAISDGVEAALGYEPAALLGRRIEDIAAADLVEATTDQWQRFLADGRQDGEFRLLRRDGQEVAMRFQARAHHPIAGFHSSRLWPMKEPTA